MNWLDIVIIVCIISGIIHGLFTGIIKQVISLVSLVAAILLSGAVAKVISFWLQPYIHTGDNLSSQNALNVIYYIIAFIIIISIFAIATYFVDKIINHTPVGIINKIFGALFGFFFWALCLSITFNILAVFDAESKVISKPVIENSIYYDRVKMIFPSIFPYIKDFINTKQCQATQTI